MSEDEKCHGCGHYHLGESICLYSADGLKTACNCVSYFESFSARDPKAEGRLTTPGEEPGASDSLHPANSLPSASNSRADPSPEPACEACVFIRASGSDTVRASSALRHVQVLHALILSEKERADRLAQNEAVTARAIAAVLAENDAALKEAEELLRKLKNVTERCEIRGDTNEGLLQERDEARREAEELRSKYDCGKNPCAWVGGLCLRHAAEYCRYLEQKFSKLRSAIQEAYGYLSDVPSGQPAYEYLARIGAAGQALKGILEGKADP